MVKDIAMNPGPFTGSLGGSLDSGGSDPLKFSESIGFSVSEARAGLVIFVNDFAINPGPFKGPFAGSFVAFSGFCSSRGVCAILAGFFGAVGLGVFSFDSPIRCPVFICCSRSRKDLYLVAGLVPNDVLLNVFLVVSASLSFVFNLRSSLTTFVSLAPYCGLFSAFNVGFDAFGFIGGSRFRMTGVTKFTSKGDWLLLGKGGASSSSFWYLL